ncbi:MAG: hypothetical protein STSR0009_01690 [Methanoregula sp.]
MPLEIQIGPHAERFLLAAEQPLAERLATRIGKPAGNPSPVGQKSYLGDGECSGYGSGIIASSIHSKPGILFIVNIDKRLRCHRRDNEQCATVENMDLCKRRDKLILDFNHDDF